MWTKKASHNYRSLFAARPSDQSWLYGVIDSAADDTLYAQLQAESTKSRVTCLFEGSTAIRYDNTAPYVMKVHENSALFANWLDHGWSKHWGIWLSSGQPLETIKLHLKKFLIVSTPGSKKSYLRFYDPRIMDQLMPILSPGQRGDIFGLNHKNRLDAFYTVVSKTTSHPPRLNRYVPNQDLAMHFAGASKLQVDQFNWA